MCRRIKRKCYQIQKHFSAPLSVYFLILIISFVLMLLQMWWKCGFSKDVLANIGYSLFASWLAAILVDYGNNKILNKKQLKEFKLLCFNHNQLTNDLFITVSGLYEENYDPEIRDITFKKMIEKMLDPQYRKYNITKSVHEECISEISHIIVQFYEQSKALEKTLEEHIENPFSTGYFRGQLSMIAYYAKIINDAIEQGKNGAAAKTINKRFLPTIVKIYPETKEYFEE